MLDEQELLALVDARLERKLRKAEEAYVREMTSKKAANCYFGGRTLNTEQNVCRLQCQGMTEGHANLCWLEKAQGCLDFQLKKSLDTLISDFRAISQEELALRWPSIGELLWLRRKILELQESSKPEGESVKDEDTGSPPQKVG